MRVQDEAVGRAFFAREIHQVARDLLGRELWVGERGARIVEVEVYEGANDTASHARSGVPSVRTWPMFAEPGRIYVYRIYGMHRCVNLRAPSRVGPGAILVRAAEPLSGFEARVWKKRRLSGPALLCKEMGIDERFSGAWVGQGIVVRKGGPVAEAEVGRRERVGLNAARCGDAARWPWRYVIEGSPWLSRP
ncbi:DNA-3-methyladenine glycosylase [Lujinxingia vulgaris]|uniref:Putative 3-methyladenine DNA glycosylase n=1 Tax=Lujinxingia vulgaris TaxID=2600176 RepID=A0A5C6X2Y1_9DELT|nr:DNA-3-methyladenine glycosylase [Lujinxingia vulgaris]TXD35494.1 DNA-3-methyladenine glycosylase [Lujinxingia vulgaris]